MRRRRRWLAVIAATAAFALPACGRAVAASGGSPRTVHIAIHWSRYTPATVRVPRGTTVRFVVTNTDPIDHELIVGDDAVQLRHESGTETHHEAPGEISIPAHTTATTTYTFGSPGEITYACHLPGHFAYGMRGAVVVSA